MLIKINNTPPIKSGDYNFAQYYADHSFSTGVVKRVDDIHVVVDFGDIVIEFEKRAITFVFDTQSNSEIFMTTDEGRIVMNYK